MTAASSFWDRRVLPVLVDLVCGRHGIFDERKRWVPRASGHVLEVGVGSGLNLALYDARRVEDVVGIDPAEALLARARRRVAGAAVPVELVTGSAEEMPFDAARFDSVVVTYTLCSVSDPAAALREIARVVKPGGKVLFIEHGLARDAKVRRWQHRLTPAWRAVGGNCHLDRDVARELEDAGLVVEAMRTDYSEGSPRWLGFTYEGMATKGVT